MNQNLFVCSFLTASRLLPWLVVAHVAFHLVSGANSVATRPFQREPDFGVTSVNYDFPELMSRAEPRR